MENNLYEAKNMKKEELKVMMENALETAKMILEEEEKLVPVAFMKYNDNIDIIALSFGDNDAKDKQLSILRDRVKEKHADSIFVVTESWYVLSDSGDIAMEPSKDPTRKECIMMIGECGEGNFTIMQTFERKDRVEDNKIVFGEKIDIEKMVSSKFNFGIKDRKKQNMKLRNLN